MEKVKYQISLLGIIWITVPEDFFYRWNGWKRVRRGVRSEH